MANVVHGIFTDCNHHQIIPCLRVLVSTNRSKFNHTDFNQSVQLIVNQEWRIQIDEIKRSKVSKADEDTIFHHMVHSNLPDSEKVTFRLQQEAASIIYAGQDTTGESAREMQIPTLLMAF